MRDSGVIRWCVLGESWGKICLGCWCVGGFGNRFWLMERRVWGVMIKWCWGMELG